MSAIVFIPLGKGKVTVIDFEDRDKVLKYKWRATDEGYVRGWVGPKKILLHRFITNPKSDVFCDHINRDGLDNRKENLRFCTKSQNSHNAVGKSGKVGNLPKGVFLHGKLKNRYQSEITVSGKRKYIGYFKTVEEAKSAYNEASVRLVGKFHRP